MESILHFILRKNTHFTWTFFINDIDYLQNALELHNSRMVKCHIFQYHV